MARAKEIDFSSQGTLKKLGNEEHNQNTMEVLENESITDNVFSDIIKDENKDVIIVVRDRKNLSLALRKLKCCSDCFPGSDCSCRIRKDSSGSIISSCSQNVGCNKCTKSQVPVHEKMSQESIDEVDGSRRKSSSTTQLVDAFFKLAFLKILLVDIGISLGDTVTDFLQGFNLIIDFSDGSLRLASINYGAAIILASWLPMMVAFLHLGFSHNNGFLRNCKTFSGLLWIVLAGVAFPLVPTVFYVWLLVSPRQTAKDRIKYKQLERQAHEIKSICGSIESPIQLILLLYLMMRGILTLPWNEPLSSKCVTDSLGRVACLPSLPMASVIFSILSIMKALFDLNIYPLVREYETSSRTFKMSLDLLLKFMPFFLANALFRICAFSLMFVFLDFWSIIPCLILFLLNLMIFGISFRRISSTMSASGSDEMNSVQLNRLSTVDMVNQRLKFGSSIGTLPVTPTDEEKRNVVVGWVPPDNMEYAHPEVKPYKYDQIGWNSNLAILSPPTPSAPIPCFDLSQQTQSTYIDSEADGQMGSNLMDRMHSIISSSDKTDTPSYINEENTSIFLNAMTGMFFPSCHTHLEPIGYDLAGSDPNTFYNRNNERQEKLIRWQKKIYQRQVYLFNIVLMLVIAVILVLVSSVQSFNYNANVMNSFWFSISLVFLLVSGIISILMAVGLNETELGQKCMEMKIKQKALSTCCADESSSIHESSDDPPVDKLSKRSLCLNTFVCLALSVVVFLPVIAGLILYSVVHKTEPYVFLIMQNETNSEKIDLSILTAFPIHSPGSEDLGTTSGKIDFDCFVDSQSNLSGKILLVNGTRPKCKSLLKEKDFYIKAMNAHATGIILLDDTPKSHWRVSSPYSAKITGLLSSGSTELMKDKNQRKNIPFLLIRESDWRKFDSHFAYLYENNKNIFIVWNNPTDLNLEEVFSCTNQVKVKIGNENSKKYPRSECLEGKHLYKNGSLSEKICVTGRCSVFGQACPHSSFDSLRDFSVNLECDSLDETSMEIVNKESTEQLQPDILWTAATNSNTDYCCNNDNTREFNSTFLEVLGSGCFDNWRDVKRTLDRCSFTSWVRGKCAKENREVYRLCLVNDGGCDNVIREYYNTLCTSDVILPHCRNSQTLCR